MAIARALDLSESLLDLGSEGADLRQSAFEDGPHHRRAASSILGTLLVQLLDDVSRKLDAAPRRYRGDAVDVDWSLPPHLRNTREAMRYSAGAPLPVNLLSRLCANRRELDEMVEALSDGPEHDVAANVVFLHLIESIHDLIHGGAPPPGSVSELPDDERTGARGRGSVRPASPRRESARGEESPLLRRSSLRPEPASEPLPSPASSSEIADARPAGKDRSILDWGFRMKFWKIRDGDTGRDPG